MPEDLRKYIPNLEEKVKSELVLQVSADRSSQPSRNIQKLLGYLIQSIREQNDHAPIKAVIRNQGKITGYEELLEILTKDFPEIKKLA